MLAKVLWQETGKMDWQEEILELEQGSWKE